MARSPLEADPWRLARRSKRRGLCATPDVLYPPSAMAPKRKDQVLRTIRQMGLVRPVELEALGVSRGQFYNLVREGLVKRRARGIYVTSRHSYTTDHTLAQVAKRVRGGVFCLLTALRFHGLTTQSPAEVWV